ncbi:MAG: endonuclease MutS2, partial [Gemmatimonadetes bacterium]|nr:endonuclease MutS2 [Gemmatimonadota bacterium]
LAREKNVNKDVVFGALEQAIGSATKKRFTEDVDVRVAIDRETGEYESFRRWQVVPDDAVEIPAQQIPLSEAKAQYGDVQVEDYIEEPLDTIEMNNRIVQLGEDEAAEIARILAELTDALRSNAGPLRAAAETIAEIDSTFARARFAREFDCVLPSLSEGGALRLDEARHPVLEHNLRRQGRAIVPMSLALGGSESVLVISGPNTGGKTVALKTAGLAALAAAAGIPVAAQRAELPLFDRVLVDIGDEQSITADLSTFSAHITNLRAMLAEATARSLVLVDEMGTGTAPEEGAALAVALLEEFRARRCLTIATTHHDRLKTYASTTTGVLNAAVEFDTVALRPTYRLLVGVPGVSSG